MIFADLLPGVAAFLDANTLVYHFAAIATHRVGDRPDRYEPRVKSGGAITTAG